jgi:hypothetical protein
VALLWAIFLTTACSTYLHETDDIYYGVDNGHESNSEEIIIMSALAAPDNWIIEVGTWGTDLDRVEGNANSIVGATSVKFLATSVATSITGADPVPVEPDQGYSVYAYVNASATAGHTVTLEIIRYDATLTVLGTSTVYSGIPGATPGTYEYVGGTVTTTPNTRFINVRIKKSATAYSLIIDRIVLERFAPTASLQNVAASLTADGTFRPVVFSTGTAFNSTSMMTVIPASGRIDIFAPGVYYVEAYIRAYNFNVGDDFGLRLTLPGAITSPTLRSEDVVVNDTDGISLQVNGLARAGTPLPGATPMNVILSYISNSAGSPTFSISGYLEVTRVSYW